MTQITDPREIHQRAMAQTESIVAAVPPGQLGLPTPCPEYDVRALLSHIVGGLNRVAIMGEGGEALAQPARALPTSGGTTPPSPPAARRPASSNNPSSGSQSAVPVTIVPWILPLRQLCPVSHTPGSGPVTYRLS